MIDVLVLAGVGLLTTGGGTAVSRGRTDLLAQLPDRSGSPELAVRTGRILTLYGVLTLGVALVSITHIGISIELWFAWMGLTVLVGVGVAVLAVTGD